MRRTILLVISVCLLASFPAHAWGPEGHEIVGRIAELHLTAPAAHAIQELLKNGHAEADSISADNIANWPDHIRQDRPETVYWHFVDIPLEAAKYDPERDCPPMHGCVIEAIARYREVLGDKSATAATRVEALKFLVHFIGDLHQPLHCAARNRDQGGNRCYVSWPGESKPVRLHAVWDFNLLGASLHATHRSPFEYAAHLNTAISPNQIAAWAKGTAVDWAWESHEVAATVAYQSIPLDCSGVELSPEYIKAGRQAVDEQLQRAGIRLATVLNEVLK